MTGLWSVSASRPHDVPNLEQLLLYVSQKKEFPA